ncbi:30S ribosomal protein S17 [Candidatus Marinamargulisbacteria bacterium SCGC AAA071-K20]|nr:30S ribosomal protein S17 [Candidatus Marinamargulisbacteria bacterium SCGC AAA071-K20]
MERNKRSVKQGTVVKLPSSKTVTVLVMTSRAHPKYKKIVKYSKKYQAHYEGKEELSLGDNVNIMSCRPISKNKSWRVEKVLKG